GEVEYARIRPGSALLEDRGRAAGKDDGYRVSALDLLPGRIEGDHLRINARFSDSSGDQLGVLGAKIKDENGLVAGRHFTFSKKGKYSMRAATEFLTTETQGRSREDVHMARQEIVPPLHRAESFTRGLIPGAAPDGLPQAIELS